MKPIYFIFLVLLLGFWGCQNDSKTNKSEHSLAQEALVEWQQLVDLGHFAQAKLLSTDSTIIWLDEIADIDVEDDTIAMTILQEIHCAITSDTANCSYYIIEDGEKLDNSVQLVKVNGVWLVDVQDTPF